jgi:hypothetical protein
VRGLLIGQRTWRKTPQKQTTFLLQGEALQLQLQLNAAFDDLPRFAK